MTFFPTIKLPNSRATSLLGFGCASLMRLPDASDREYLLAQVVDYGITHFDVARLYGLGQVESEIGALFKRHPEKLTVATKFGLDNTLLPPKVTQRQGFIRTLLAKSPWLKPLARHIYGQRFVSRDFSIKTCRSSLEASFKRLGVDKIDLVLLHEPQTNDCLDPSFEVFLDDLKLQGMIGGYGISGLLANMLPILQIRPNLGRHFLQWEDSLLTSNIALSWKISSFTQLCSRFGVVRCSFPYIQKALQTVPQLESYWSDRLNIDLSSRQLLVTALIASTLVGNPTDLLLFSTTDRHRLKATLQLLHSPPWSVADLVDFDHFWRSTSTFISAK